MGVVWGPVGEYGVYAIIDDTAKQLIVTYPSLQSACNFIYYNWIYGAGMFIEIIDHTTGDILCCFEDKNNSIRCDLSGCPENEAAKIFKLFSGGKN